MRIPSDFKWRLEAKTWRIQESIWHAPRLWAICCCRCNICCCTCEVPKLRISKCEHLSSTYKRNQKSNIVKPNLRECWKMIQVIKSYKTRRGTTNRPTCMSWSCCSFSRVNSNICLTCAWRFFGFFTRLGESGGQKPALWKPFGSWIFQLGRLRRPMSSQKCLLVLQLHLLLLHLGQLLIGLTQVLLPKSSDPSAWRLFSESTGPRQRPQLAPLAKQAWRRPQIGGQPEIVFNGLRTGVGGWFLPGEFGGDLISLMKNLIFWIYPAEFGARDSGSSRFIWMFVQKRRFLDIPLGKQNLEWTWGNCCQPHKFELKKKSQPTCHHS